MAPVEKDDHLETTDDKPATEFPSYHAGEELIRQMMVNLSANNRNPEAIEEQRTQRDLKRAIDTRERSAR